ncbi:vesicle transport protein SFT2A isoform X3 [Mustela putorius furo]|uniref:Vesicle transport protein SFT2A isoform X3 n=1 Tax=Mustela putorius furo TaxID=9669 RepID=A0A8U0S427_MUSPF|nr:vesicle transport protein SFT2A isoform X3 [Mustela putorius furo]
MEKLRRVLSGQDDEEQGLTAQPHLRCPAGTCVHGCCIGRDTSGTFHCRKFCCTEQLEAWGPGRLVPQLQHQAEVVRHLLRMRHFLLCPGDRIAVASWWHKAVCGVLYLWKSRRACQYLLSDGTREAAEEDV